MKKYCILLFFLAISLKGISDPPLQYLGIENGLSNNAVTCIFQDSHGFMWFGTYNGLNRYDGYNFKVFRNHLNDSTSLVNNWITSISEDNSGNIWVGTKQGAEIYSNYISSFSPLYYIPYKEKGHTKLVWPVNCFEKDNKDNFFIGTAGKGLLINTITGEARQVPYVKNKQSVLSSYHVQAIHKDASDKLWLFIQGEGIACYDYKSGYVMLVDDQVKTGACIQTDLEGNLWIGSENGLYQYTVSQKKVTLYKEGSGSVSGNNIVSLCLDKSGELWIATDGGGVDILNVKTGKFRYLYSGENKGSLTSSAVHAVYQDKDLRIWIGTLRGGVNIIDQKKNRFTTISRDPLSRNPMISNFILSFCEDKMGNIWIGSDGEGLSYWNRKLNTFTNYAHVSSNSKSLINNNVVRIVQDYQGQIWLATYGGGVDKFNNKDNSFIHYRCQNSVSRNEDRNVWSLYEDSRKNLWAGCTGGGLYKFNRELNKFELFDKNLTDVLTLTEDKSGDLWAGNFSELIKIDLNHKNHKVYPIGYAVRAIYEDDYKNFWIGTEGGGLLKFNMNTGALQRFAENEGLPNNAVLNILADNEGNLWISTFYGLSRFTMSNGKFKNFFESDGLQSNQFNYNAAITLRDGELLFGGIKGFNIFSPDKIKPNISSSNVLLTELRVNYIPFEKDNSIARGQSVYTIKEIILPYYKAVLSADFTTPEYTAPDKIKYAYYLEGWDKGWNYSGSVKTANYSKLQEGHYILRIKSTNAEGVWNNIERTISITVLPPWWRSWWAELLYLIVIMGGIYTIVLFQRKRASLEYTVQLANLKIEQERDLNEKKLSFFTHIAHEFRTPLTLIINPVKEILYSHRQMIDNGELSIVYRNSKRLLSLVDQLLLFRQTESNEDHLKIVKLDFPDVCKEVYLCFQQQAKARNIQYDFTCDSDIQEVYADREKIEIVLFNLIMNAIKYTPEGGKVVVAIIHNADKVIISVSDTGCGIPEDTGEALFNRFFRVKGTNQKSGFGIGLYLVKKFTEAHKGSVGYTSKLGEGSEFRVSLLKGKAHFGSVYVSDDSTESSVLFKELVEQNDTENSEALIVDYSDGATEELVSEKPVLFVVDDDDDIREYIKRIFNNKYVVYEANNGDEGYKLIKKYQPDIVLCDVVMNGMNGIELCHQIKEDPSLTHIPFILLTASSSDEIKLRGIEEGADDYITKPFEKELLVARVAGLLKSRDNLQKYFYNEVTLQANDFQISSEYSEFLKKCIEIIEKHLDDPDFNIKVFAAEIGVSHSNLYKKVKSISGRSVNEFMRFIKLRKVAEILINSDCNVNEAAFRAGFNDIRYFREQFHKLFGINPSEYVKKYRKPFKKMYNIIS